MKLGERQLSITLIEILINVSPYYIAYILCDTAYINTITYLHKIPSKPQPTLVCIRIQIHTDFFQPDSRRPPMTSCTHLPMGNLHILVICQIQLERRHDEYNILHNYKLNHTHSRRIRRKKKNSTKRNGSGAPHFKSIYVPSIVCVYINKLCTYKTSTNKKINIHIWGETMH